MITVSDARKNYGDFVALVLMTLLDRKRSTR